ncbi:hypothetical protein HN51_000938 [Arachis hypogaea]|uniref:Protein NUCLEAR FUSION DEFECTIVE 4-like n=2 Tax=Arachis TaxID=3817 RepID=A0A6P4CQE5_ARADU|nr:protein NUCLEAR FUSION DEFECTIVE 4-like [Arachis duranensis]XP_025696762.1 protein NUCLEAR FUSION DEFECTIVE 4-like [Arachis hypogaea]XP_052117630.1 protein NUCLEAR FUSION DEFECTIVE 4-like [Arachis duranensis]QHO48948.1 Protein NUCLEAR FUSION DEFECTIVE [Arachis hypogaea]RYR78909.1 hypothetical protein Ahy_A01g003775 [Arachis hypogaea]
MKGGSEIMLGNSRKWIIVVVTIWLQAFTGTNFDFSQYSSAMKSALNISQMQLNYLATANDMGKLFGWSSGFALMYFPLPAVMFIAAAMGFVSYGLQWLLLQGFIHLPYFLVFVVSVLGGVSICWFNTVCFVLCIRSFPVKRALALSLTVSFNGVSGALYTLAANSIDPSSPTLYLLLNALLPLLVSFAAAFFAPIMPHSPAHHDHSNSNSRDSIMFLVLNLLATLTGLYLLLFASHASAGDVASNRLFLGGAIFLLLLPLFVAYASSWSRPAVHDDDLELHKELIISCKRMLEEEQCGSAVLGRLDFWLYYVTYICGGTIGLVYSNNLGQIAESVGTSCEISTLVMVYASFSFFGRLLSALPDYIGSKLYFARTGWLCIALIPTPVAFTFMALSQTPLALPIGTALIGFSSGFIFAAAVSVTSELFGPNSVAVNHNLLITNIPIGSLVYGFLSALLYDANTNSGVCIGRQCYFWTFVCWACTAVLGLLSSLLLFFRTKHAYQLHDGFLRG